MNELYPIFLKAHQLNILLVGAGNVGLEKLSFLLKSSPNATVNIVAEAVNKEVKNLADKHQLIIHQRSFEFEDLNAKHLVIAATNNSHLNNAIYAECRMKKLLVNVADKPDLCDFYLGGIVTKGNVKIAISTNGKSHSTAKRLRQFFEEVLPEDINDLVLNLNAVRHQIKESLKEKTKKINELTSEFLSK